MRRTAFRFPGRSPVFITTVLLLLPTALWAHAIAGMRVFPGTLSIDDPGVVNEFGAVFGSIKAGGVKQNGIDFDYAKTLTRRFGLTLGTGYQWLKNDAGGGVSAGCGSLGATPAVGTT